MPAEAAGLSPAAQALLRTSYGVLLTLTLLQALPQARRFFTSERWGGYARSGRLVDLVMNPYVLPPLLAAWIASAVLLVVGLHTLVAAFVNLALCYYFFVVTRWRSVLRGMGAPGFMTFWLGACVFFLECGLAGDSALRRAALLTFRADFAVIMLCAGTYKALAGYARNDGMELGMVNPFWGYWGGLYRRLPPNHWLFRSLNQLAWTSEVAAGLLLLFPPTQALGALVVAASFAFVALQIRLGFLAEMVIVCAVLFVPAGSVAERLLPAGLPSLQSSPGLTLPASLAGALSLGLYGYLVLLPFVKAGQYYNLLARRALPRPMQLALDRYANLFGLSIWRVFSADHTDFYAKIFVEDATGTRHRYGGEVSGWAARLRYWHVGESICLTSLFTTLKYYPSSETLFTERLVRYARTIPRAGVSRVLFEYVRIRKDGGSFHDVPAALFSVDPERAKVECTTLDDSLSVSSRSRSSPIHEARGPGSYAPATGP